MTENRNVNELTSANELLVRCAWCERIKVDDAWIAVTEMQAAQPTPDTVMQHSHGICPDCFAQLTP